ncbi:MAG: tRNA uridine-5-carboxymethylaminomethyl(34) synthesis GTPase MnmE [Beijerinckiaceae bacterium]|nr:tRNA uridine-5-carboxymethylaminomethyl(34) synthesis GTPase MnmE [Beijerinckiaceae bacterium]
MDGARFHRAETIYALSSASGRAGIAVVRVSGPLVRHILRSIVGDVPRPRLARLAKLRHAGEVIDEGLVLFFGTPNSFTGEDLVEFQVHGSPAVVARLFRALNDVKGVRLAEPGEFTRRALIAGKIDLVGAEALADLIDSDTEQQRRLAIDGQSGRLQSELKTLRRSLLEARALVEADIDFSDEGDVPDALLAAVEASVLRVEDRLRAMLVAAKDFERIRTGFRVVLAGDVNAGKSTLLNALVGRDAAIVSSKPGTTRDTIEVSLDLGGWPVVLVDTAGIRSTDDEVEQEGIKRAERALASADVVLHLSRSDHWPILTAAEDKPVLVVRSQIDSYPSHSGGDAIRISALTGDGIGRLLSAIEHRLPKERALIDQPVVFRERQRLCLNRALEALTRLQPAAMTEAELIAENLRIASDSLGRLIGDIMPEEVLGEIFGRFCIGK